MNHRPPPSVRLAALALVALSTLAAPPGCRSPFKRGAERPVVAPSGDARYVTTHFPPANRGLGRVVSHDAAGKTVLIELSPFASPLPDLTGRALVARHPETLTPSARLVASGRRAGAILGAYVVDGAPAPGHEVVLPPAP